MMDATSPSVLQFGAVLFGFDVEGFSRTVEKASLRYGRGAGEMAAQQILAGERIATEMARRAGLRFADALGDGAVYLRPQEAPTARDVRALQQLQEELRYAHLKHTGLSIRTAWAHGQVRLTRPTTPMLEHSDLLWGPAVADLHQTLSGRSRGWRRARDSQPPPPNLTDREGEIAEMTFVFLRLCDCADWELISEETLNAALDLVGRWADHLDGRLERITQDEKGLHVRVGLPGVEAGERDWRATLLEPQSALKALGLDGAIAAAGGPVYRGPSEHGSTIVHGGAVNRAAKLCASQAPGGLTVDASLACRPPRAARPAGVMIGRRREMETARRWLAGAGPRMVLFSGAAGVGKSHLMRGVAVHFGDAMTAAISGAPARVLDPMGAWFELLGQMLAKRQPPEADRPWALQALARAGLPPSLIALCARALRGVETSNAETAALTGGARATRTAEAVHALVEVLADETPMLLVVDDLHELDDASLTLTLAVLEGGRPVRIIATSRTSRGDVRLEPLRRHLSTLEMSLSPLSAPDIAALVGSLSSSPLDPDEVMAISAGNPFEAVQVALALAENDRTHGDRTVGAILDRRLDRLDVDEREVLRALSIADRSWRAEDLDAIAPPEGGRRETDRRLATLGAARLVEADASEPDKFRVAHRLVTEAVRRRTPAGVKRRLARRAARRLMRPPIGARHAPAVEVARLWAEAGSRGRAAILYERAARSAAADGADSTCAQLLGMALDLFEPADPVELPRRAVRWLAELSRAEWSLGRVDTANFAARRSIACARRRVLSTTLRDSAVSASALRAETGQFLGNLGEILIGSVDAGRLGGAGSDRISAQGRGISALGYLLGLIRLNGAADKVLSRGESMATHADPRPAAFALTARAILHFVFGSWVDGEIALASARSICAAFPQHHLMEVIETTCGIGAHLQGDGDRALTHFDALLARANARGSDLHAGWADYATAQTLLALGRPHEGWRRLESAEDRLKGLTDRQSHHICLGLRARLALALGEMDEALEAATACGEASRELPPTNYSSTEAFSAPALVGSVVEVIGTSTAQRRAGGALARGRLGDLERYAVVFPIARPRLAIVRASMAAIRRPGKALERFDLVGRRAELFGLGFEARLARETRALLVQKL